MNETKFSKIKVETIFDFPEMTSKITKTYCRQHPGDIPVYGSSKNEGSVLGKIADNIPGVKYYQNCLSWNRNGSVGYVFLRNHRFSTSDDHRALVLKNCYKDKVNLLYLKFELERALVLAGFSFMKKCGVSKIKNVEIRVPIDDNGNFDFYKQMEIARRFEKLRKMRAELEAQLTALPDVKLNFDNSYEFADVRLDRLFDFAKGKDKYTIGYIRRNKGDFPVYSSQTTNRGEIGRIDTYDFDGEAITWTTDGVYAGTTFYRHGKFSMTTHCGALILKSAFLGQIDLKYISYTLLPILKEKAVSYGNKRVTLKDVKMLSLRIPVSTQGGYDFAAQRVISDSYSQIYQIQDNIRNEFQDLIQRAPTII